MSTSPPDIPGLLFWYSFAAGLQFTDFGITPASHQGDLIQQVNDLSGNGNTATQTSGSKPTADVSQSAWHFISGSFLILPNVFNGCTQAEIFWVIRSAREDIQRGFAAFNTSDFGSHYTFSDSNIYSGFLTTTRNTVGHPMTLNRQFRIYEECSHTSSWFANMDGANIYTRNSNTFQNDTTAPNIGINNTGYTFDGWIQQVFAYNRVLNPTERLALTTTLIRSTNTGSITGGIRAIPVGANSTQSVVGMPEPFIMKPVVPTIAITGSNQSIIVVNTPLQTPTIGKTVLLPFLPPVVSGSITGSDTVHVPKAGQLFPLGNR